MAGGARDLFQQALASSCNSHIQQHVVASCFVPLLFQASEQIAAL
jgi:hypothetical protein